MPYYAYICPDIACGHMTVSEENIHESHVVQCILCGREFFRKYFGFLPVERKFFREVEKRNEHTRYRYGKSFIRINGVSELLCESLSQMITQYGILHDCQSTHCPWSAFQLSIHPSGMGLLNAGIDCSRFRNYYATISEIDLQTKNYGIAVAACKVVIEIRRSIAKGIGRPMNALIPVEVPTGEYSLVYSISRILCGRTVLWHPLITAVHEHLKTNLSRYEAKLRDSHPIDEWSEILKACDPLNVQELSRIHIYIMSNVLCRPIILFSSMSDCHTELSCTFLPSLMELECYDKNRVGSPIVLSWMDGNFFDIVPWLPLKGRSLQNIPVYLLPPVYYDECGVENYMEIENGCCTPYKGCTEFKEIESTVAEFRIIHALKTGIDWQLIVDFCEDAVVREEFDKEKVPYYASMCLNVARSGYLKRCTNCSFLMILVERHFDRGFGFYDSTTKFLLSNLKPLVHGVRICGKETDFMYNDKNGMFEVIEVNQKHACRSCFQDNLVGELVIDEPKLKKLSKFEEIAQKSTIDRSLFLKILRLLKAKNENKFWNVAMFRIDNFLRNGSVIDKFVVEDEEMLRKREKYKRSENLHFRLPGLFPGQVFVRDQKSNEYALCLGYLGHHRLYHGLMDGLVNGKIMSMRQMEHFQDKIARARDFNRGTPIDAVVALSTDCPR